MITGTEAPRSWPTDPELSVVFARTKEAFGGLSNMASGFPLTVNDVGFRTAEALYQALRFPDAAEVQRKIIDQPSPMGAKLVSREHDASTRADWQEVRVPIMRWCLEVKLRQHGPRFASLLRETSGREIVEYSKRDAFWGAVRGGEGDLEGRNVLGRLLMELRDDLSADADPASEPVMPLRIEHFQLLGEPIAPVGPGSSALPEDPQARLFQPE